ncbi:MAG: hypothetical protein IPG04_14565 [Polyangiaceae bacterium]|jgi:hypothetical protein|nr:hypothetical protein [Polyangiaceae bacterium]
MVKRLLPWLLVAVLGAGCSCSAGNQPDDDDDGGGAGQGGDSSVGAGNEGGGFSTGGAGTGGAGSDCVAEAELVYLVSYERQLYSFDPNVPGTAAYTLIGTLGCSSTGFPQSMSVDKSGVAWVFYDTGELFRVSTLDASCTPTTYVHPVQNGFNQLGMGFTATSPGVFDDVLYVVSPDFGLATVAFPSFAVTQLGGLVGAAELTGGPDALLFHFAASSATLSQVDTDSLTTSFLHTFNGLQGTQAWAFSRYAGKFYMFTSDGIGFGSTCTVYDPQTNSEMVRDQNVGFTVVGAGQSICVPPPVPQ